MAIEASCIDSLHVPDIVKISGESQESTSDCYLELLLSCADGREVR